jgi:hypothetical protein
MSSPVPPLEQLNTTELLHILRSGNHGHLRISRAVPRERLIQLIQTGERPRDEEIAQTAKTRSRLEAWIQKHIDSIGSQLPCSGPQRGMCTVYPCTEGRHMDCYLSVKEQLNYERI